MMNAGKHNIKFHFADIRFPFHQRKALKAFIAQIFLEEGKKAGELSFVFCSDEHLLQINRQFLLHDYYTDIITFDLSGGKDKVDGEIYISIDRVKENADTFRAHFSRELHRVIFHGILHLCGYKDKTSAQKKQMRTLEEKYLQQYYLL
jgi:rRNA maturation RNase YbeY